MSTPTKTEGRLLEQAFYRDHAARQRADGIDFAPIEGNQRRPWNPYWYVFETLRTRFVGPWQRLLDFACGDGVASIRLARLGYQVDGCDASIDHCNAATRLANQYELSDRCEIKLIKEAKLGYDDRYFDIVAGIDAMSGRDLDAAVAETCRVLKPGGIAIYKDHADARLIDACHSTFERVDIKRFTLLSGVDRLMRACSDTTRGRVQRLDHRVLQLCPPLAKLGGTVVLICQKQGYR